MKKLEINNPAINLIIKSYLFRRVKQCLLIFFVLFASILLSACQITTPFTNDKADEINNNITPPPFSYSQYYLWLKTLSDKQVLAEEYKQTAIIAATPQENNIATQSKLILIYSLSTTDLHQPYKAKRLLNELLILSHNMKADNLAFTMLLRDQLNTQLYLLEKQNATNKDCNEQLDGNHVLIEQLQSQVNQVNQQLILLKRIDLNINERG
jgi:hypothetical protein